MTGDDPKFKQAVVDLHNQIVQQIAPHVLVVDDDENDVIVLRHALLEACPHIHVQWRDNATEAISCVRAFMYDLVILDLRLGLGMDGIEVFKSIRQTSTVPVIGLTGMDDTSQLFHRALEAGLKVIFKKPLDSESIGLLFGTPGAIRAPSQEATQHGAGNN